MKKVLKKLALLMLAVSMTVPAASALNMPQASVAEAASTQKLTLYVGEKYDILSAKSVKSSKKSVVKAGTDTSGSTIQRYLIAKKAGTATVTVKGKYGGTTKYKVTVKKNQCKPTLSWTDNGEVLVTVTNGSPQIFDEIDVKYTLKTSTGSVYEEKEISISNVLSKKKGYRTIYLGSKADVDLDQSSVKVTGVFHYPNYTYKNITSKIKLSTEETAASQQIELSITGKNTTNSYTNGQVYILMKDASDNLIGVETAYLSMSKKATETTTKTIPVNSNYSYPNYDHYELVAGYYSKTYK